MYQLVVVEKGFSDEGRVPPVRRTSAARGLRGPFARPTARVSRPPRWKVSRLPFRFQAVDWRFL